MPIELAALAASVVSGFLVPYAKLGAQKFADAITDKLGTTAAEHATDTAGSLWERVKGAFSSQEEQTALALFQQDPQGLAATVERLLLQRLREDEALARELGQLVEAESPDGSGTGAQIVNAGIAGIIDLRGSRVSGGTFTATSVNPAQPSSEHLEDE